MTLTSRSVKLFRDALTSSVLQVRRQSLSILIFHRVVDELDPLDPEMMDAATFDWQMELLAQMFNVMPLADAVDALRERSLPKNALCITFDDGYEDNLRVAVPILKKHGLSSTFFIVSDCMSGSLMWNDVVAESVRQAKGEFLELADFGLGRYRIASDQDRAATARSLNAQLKRVPELQRKSLVEAAFPYRKDRVKTRMMSHEEVRELRRQGMGVGAHTASHPILSQVSRQAAWENIVRGKQQLEATLGEKVDLFAYPNGRKNYDYLDMHAELAREAGFTAACSTSWGVATPRSDIWQLPRYTPWDREPGRFMMHMVQNYLRAA